ncbi:CPBP family intramembrane glutamic endopeptidase [Spiroplasma endosymbiont of Poecilobothrus nobilitatus]|uniref:CPBP family intramembrane glutamic endopeptidase n=1 Tax=Spiroplasma endosymbiont of Poecilobothrus nobilitatus TaxID=1209220 RepID=UPI00313E6808
MTNNDNVYNPKRAWYELKPTLVDRASPFDFNLVKLKNTGYIFLGTAIFAPFFINILISYMFAHNEYALAGMNFISWIIVAVGSYFVISGAQNEIMRSGAIAFYYFYFIPNIIGLVIGTIANQFHPSASVKTTINLLTLIIAGLVTIFILYRSSPLIFEKIKLTLKQDYKSLLVVCSIGIIAVFSIHLFFVYLQSLITTTTSNNQNSLIKGLDKWWNIVLLFIYTILIAPIVEELATRHGIFSLSGNKWLGFVASTIFFAGMHVAGTGDWEHFIGYIGASLTLGMLFLIVNGNVTYTIIPHAGYNCIVVILMFITPKFLA